MNILLTLLSAAVLVLPASALAADRFSKLVEEGAEPTTTKGGYLVNNKRVAVQAELSRQGPTASELGVKLPPGARLNLETTARQIAQYHPVWRVYDYKLTMPRAEFVRYFEGQGLVFDRHKNAMLFPGAAPDEAQFIDGLTGDPVTGFRIWRRP